MPGDSVHPEVCDFLVARPGGEPGEGAEEEEQQPEAQEEVDDGPVSVEPQQPERPAEQIVGGANDRSQSRQIEGDIEDREPEDVQQAEPGEEEHHAGELGEDGEHEGEAADGRQAGPSRGEAGDNQEYYQSETGVADEAELVVGDEEFRPQLAPLGRVGIETRRGHGALQRAVDEIGQLHRGKGQADREDGGENDQGCVVRDSGVHGGGAHPSHKAGSSEGATPSV